MIGGGGVPGRVAHEGERRGVRAGSLRRGLRGGKDASTASAGGEVNSINPLDKLSAWSIKGPGVREVLL